MATSVDLKENTDNENEPSLSHDDSLDPQEGIITSI